MTIKQFLTKYWYLTAGVVGVLSGVAVNFSDGISGAAGIFGLFVPGALLGLFSVGYFFLASLPRSTLWRLFLWVIASSLSYFLAFLSAAVLGGNLHIPVVTALLVGSLVGISVLAVAYYFLFSNLRPDVIILLYLTSTLTTFIFNSFFTALFIVWQTAVLLIFAYQIHLSAKANQNTSQISAEQ